MIAGVQIKQTTLKTTATDDGNVFLLETVIDEFSGIIFPQNGYRMSWNETFQFISCSSVFTSSIADIAETSCVLYGP